MGCPGLVGLTLGVGTGWSAFLPCCHVVVLGQAAVSPRPEQGSSPQVFIVCEHQTGAALPSQSTCPRSRMWHWCQTRVSPCDKDKQEQCLGWAALQGIALEGCCLAACPSWCRLLLHFISVPFPSSLLPPTSPVLWVHVPSAPAFSALLLCQSHRN